MIQSAKLAYLLLVLISMSCSSSEAAAQRQKEAKSAAKLVPAMKVSFPALARNAAGDKIISGWSGSGDDIIAAPGNPQSPRRLQRNFPDSTPAVATAHALEDGAITDTKFAGPSEVTMFRQWKGTPAYFVIGSGVHAGSPHGFALWGSAAPDGSRYTILLHAPESVWTDWGGVVAALGAFDVKVNPATFDRATRIKLSAAPLETQVKVFNVAANAYLKTMYISGLGTANMGALQTMRQMNADIGTRTSCMLTSGCQVGIGANGEATMTYPDN